MTTSLSPLILALAGEKGQGYIKAKTGLASLRSKFVEFAE